MVSVLVLYIRILHCNIQQFLDHHFSCVCARVSCEYSTFAVQVLLVLISLFHKMLPCDLVTLACASHQPLNISRLAPPQPRNHRLTPTMDIVSCSIDQSAKKVERML
jgi:hypothetical protein